MHELSIAMSLIDVVTDAALQQGGGRVEAIHLKLGPLSGVLKDSLLSAFELASESTPLAGAELIIHDVPVLIQCPTCSAPRPVASIQEMRCQSCGTLSPEVIQGRELEITAMEICDEPAPIS